MEDVAYILLTLTKKLEVKWGDVIGQKLLTYALFAESQSTHSGINPIVNPNAMGENKEIV